jgi:hypothetical protein
MEEDILLPPRSFETSQLETFPKDWSADSLRLVCSATIRTSRPRASMSVFVARSAGPHGNSVVGYKMAWVEVVEPSRTALA